MGQAESSEMVDTVRQAWCPIPPGRFGSPHHKRRSRAEDGKVGANDDPDAKGSDVKTGEDLLYLAQLGAHNDPKTNIAYEPWCFSPRVSDWEHCWEIIKDIVSQTTLPSQLQGNGHADG